MRQITSITLLTVAVAALALLSKTERLKTSLRFSPHT